MRSSRAAAAKRPSTSADRDLDSPNDMNVSKKAPWRQIAPFELIDAPLGEVCDLVDGTLAVPDSAHELEPILGHLRQGSGKMIRPGLLLLAGMCFGGLKDEHVRVGAMVEMIHNATLLHDDVIDDGQVRRGLPTVNRLWGNESAVLSGDFVLSQVFVLGASLDVSIGKVVAETAARVCAGELRQVAQRRNWELTESEYISIISDKSAAFFGGCCRLGALLSEAQPDQIEAMARYGLNAGIAFQIADDLLDIAGHESRTGKTAQCDLAKSKLTLAVIHLLRDVDSAARERVRTILDQPAEAADELAEMLDLHGSLEYARNRARQYVQISTEALESVPSGDAKDALIDLAGFMVERTG